MEGILLIIFIFFVAWDAVGWVLGIKPLFLWQLKKKLGSGSSDLLLLDVRTPMEFGWFHLPEAQNDPNLLFETKSIQAMSPDQPMLIICMTGHHSPIVGYSLERRDLKNFIILPGECWDRRLMNFSCQWLKDEQWDHP
jgi:rhodanese-related sulfurtransferase